MIASWVAVQLSLIMYAGFSGTVALLKHTEPKNVYCGAISDLRSSPIQLLRVASFSFGSGGVDGLKFLVASLYPP